MRFERLVIFIGCVRLVDVGQRLGPGQRRTLTFGEMLAYPPTREAIQPGIGHPASTQRLRVHFQTERASVDLRHPQPDQFDQILVEAALFQGGLGQTKPLIGFRTKGVIRKTFWNTNKKYPMTGEALKDVRI